MRNRNEMGMSLWCRVTLFTSVVCGSGQAGAQEATPGAVQTHPIVSVSLQASSTGKETKRVVYAPPPGWHIRSHRVDCTKKSGLSSFTVNTLPAAWAWKAEEEKKETGSTKAAAAVAGHGLKTGAEADAETNTTQSERAQATSSHHVLVVEVIAQGSGLLRGPGAVELTVIADLVFVGGCAEPQHREIK
jgi:hypothetical protein